MDRRSKQRQRIMYRRSETESTHAFKVPDEEEKLKGPQKSEASSEEDFKFKRSAQLQHKRLLRHNSNCSLKTRKRESAQVPDEGKQKAFKTKPKKIEPESTQVPDKGKKSKVSLSTKESPGKKYWRVTQQMGERTDKLISQKDEHIESDFPWNMTSSSSSSASASLSATSSDSEGLDAEKRQKKRVIDKATLEMVERTDQLISQKDEHIESDFPWNMTSSSATSSDSEGLDAELIESHFEWARQLISELKLKGPQESETSQATKYFEEEKLTESVKSPSEATVAEKEDDGCCSPQEEFAMLLNTSLKYAITEIRETASCSISPCLTEDGDYLCTNVLHIWPDLRKTNSYKGAIHAGLAVARKMDAKDYTGMIEKRVVCGPGYLKLKLSMKWIAQSIFKMIKGGDIAAWAPKLSVKKAILYFLSPNIGEEMHTGHLRSTVIGETLARILEYSGVEVFRRFREGDDVDVKLKMMEFLIERYHKDKGNDQATGELEGWDGTHENACFQISKMTREHYQEVYQRLGVPVEEVLCFDPFYKRGIYISATLDLLREKGLMVESEGDKAILIEGRKLPLIDLTALWHALNMVKADWIVHVTDVGQRDYFEMCIIAAKRAGWILNDHSPCPLRHAGFGLVQADDFDRFQTLGTKVVSLVNLFKEAKSRCKAILVGQAEKLEHTAEALGYDAVKYAVLKANRLANYTIKFDEMLNEKEDTVVYLQYTHVQIHSILKTYESSIKKLKASGMEEVEELILKNSEERELGLHLLRFTEVLEEVCKVLMPHILCEYLYDLCKKFDKMYSPVWQVLDRNDKSKLLLCEATANVMRQCFNFLGITPIYEEILKVPPVAEVAITCPYSDLTEEPLLKEPPAAEPGIVVFFSDLTEEQLMALFCEGPCFRFELCNVLLSHNIDKMVKNGGIYDELRLFGIIQAETHISDPSHYESINIFKRNFDDPLVFNKPGSLSPHDIRYCSLSVSTFVKITAEVYGTTYKGEGIECLSDYTEWYRDTWELRENDKVEYLDGLTKFLLEDTLPRNLEESEAGLYIDDDAFEVCDDYAFINFSDYFANRPNGGSGYCKLKGKDGYIELFYVALKYAVEATLEVDFAATSEETKVVGKVKAYYGKNFRYGCCPTKKDLYSSMLFETEPDNDIFVKSGKIDLTRSVLAVPAQYSLIIDANLCDFTSGDTILSGVWEFLVPTDGRVCNGLIEGNGCSLKLKVDWNLPPGLLESSSLFS